VQVVQTQVETARPCVDRRNKSEKDMGQNQPAQLDSTRALFSGLSNREMNIGTLKFTSNKVPMNQCYPYQYQYQ
jgi:hypothetical protein